MSPAPTRRPGDSAIEKTSGPIEALLACHERIRKFSEMSAALARTQASPVAVKEAARDIRRYFTEALPLHAADEAASLAPRLRASAASDDVKQALDVVKHQHPDIERMIGRLAPQWQALEADPSKLQAMAAQLGAATDRMVMLWTPHLLLEEMTIFPAAREHLKPEDLAAIRKEMIERRSPTPK